MTAFYGEVQGESVIPGSPRRLVGLLAAVATVSILTVVPGLTAQHIASPAQAASSLGFGPSTVVDDQRTAGEPDVTTCGPNAQWAHGNCGLDNPYSSAPYGFSTTSSFVWRSEDQGKTFKLIPSNDTTGKPDACPGGGDTDLRVSPGATQATDYLNFIDLQGLTNFSSGVSRNGGRSFTCDAASSVATVVDRQWFGVYGNPAGAPANHSAVYLDYDLVAGASCTGQPNADGNAFVVQKSTDGGLTYGPTVTADCNDGIVGNMEVNQTNGYIFAVHTAYTSAANSVAADAVTVDRSTDGGATWKPFKVFGCQPTATTDCTTGQDFAVLAIDNVGGLYVVWSQAPTDHAAAITGPGHIYLSYSPNQAQTWSTPVRVDQGSTNVNLFPWITAGQPGKVDVVWYGTTKSASAPSYDSGVQTTDWYPYISQSLNANTPLTTFSAPQAVSQHPNHNGGICTMGIGCTTGGDRSLADFFQVSINKSGGADVVWTDTSNNGNTSASGNAAGLIEESRQISGPTLLGTTLSGSNTVCTSAAVVCQSDVLGDARYEANGDIGANAPKLDITGSSLNVDPANNNYLDVRMIVPGLTSVPKLTDAGIFNGDRYVDYLTTWNYHVPGHTQQNYDSTGNIYYAYLEVNRATGAVTSYSGNTCSIESTKPKYLVYPGQIAVSRSINFANGNINLYVRRSDVGNPPSGATLYSVTAHTVGEPGPAGPYTCSTRDPNGNNSDPSGQIFNVYDKSPAYTSVLP